MRFLSTRACYAVLESKVMSLRILLADDHRIVVEGLRSLIEKTRDLTVVAEAATGREAVKLAQERHADIVIMDINLPDMNGIEATRQLLSVMPHVKVIGLSMHSDKRYVKGMLRAGACGYIVKADIFDDVLKAIEAAAKGRFYLSPRITGLVIEDSLFHSPESASSSLSRLTSREREILQLLAEGWATKDIASKLHLSQKTVHSHRQQIMSKLNLHSIAELTKYAIREGITSAES